MRLSSFDDFYSAYFNDWNDSFVELIDTSTASVLYLSDINHRMIASYFFYPKRKEFSIQGVKISIFFRTNVKRSYIDFLNINDNDVLDYLIF